MTTKIKNKMISPLAKHLGPAVVEQFKEAINKVDIATYEIEDLYSELEHSGKMEVCDDEASPTAWRDTCTIEDVMVQLQDCQRIMNDYYDLLQDIVVIKK
jgi:Mg2+ and Co2+ transporter CorA